MGISLKHDNGTYCPLIFNEIYADSSGEYRLCCHADSSDCSRKYKIQTHNPFEYFMSPDMEEKRKLVLSGQKLPECHICYEQEKETYIIAEKGISAVKSYRTKAFKKLFNLTSNYSPPTSVNKINLKLRINGNFCNLSCAMCIPFNSSTRRSEMDKIYPEGWDFFSSSKYVPLKSERWELIVDDIIENIDKINSMHLTGGEPLQLPKHWELLNRIPDEYAKQISLQYDTNFTKLQYKNYHIRDIVNKFKNVYFGISCDHYGEKLGYIRYPIDVKQFETNLKDTEDITNKTINCTVSLLNIEDLIQITDYYKNNFNVACRFSSIVRTPRWMSVKHLPEERKKQLIDLYIPTYNNTEDYFDQVEISYAVRELEQKGKPESIIQLKSYLRKLSENRNIDHTKLWPQYA